jgi:hypothetical protein
MAAANDILDREQLVKLSGYTRPKAIKRWLMRNGVRFTERKDGWPVTSMTAYNAALAGRATNDDGFNLEAL